MHNQVELITHNAGQPCPVSWSSCFAARYYSPSRRCVYCRRTKTQRTWWHTELCHSVCGCNKNTRQNSTVECMKTGFSPSKVGGIACCDHKMSSASSLGPYQAVCCTEHSPLALGAGHTSWHPSPCRLAFSLPFLCLSPILSVSLLPRLHWPTLPSPPRHQRLGSSIVSAPRPQCWQSSGPSEDTSNIVPALCC